MASSLLAFQIVMFAFVGVEMVGQTASESKNPQKVLPQAINSVMWRILIFYVGALIALTVLVPWFQFPTSGSPFVHAFTLIGIPAAAGVINFVVTTAALSSCNSGIYSTSRMLRTLSEDSQAPRSVGVLSGRAVPSRAIGVTFGAMLIGVVLNYFVPEQAFTYITSASTAGAIFTWAMILIAHLGYRRKVAVANSRPDRSGCRSHRTRTTWCWPSSRSSWSCWPSTPKRASRCTSHPYSRSRW